jgi:hypothetical protein
MTIGVPGNNPYVITVGAMSDNYTPADPADDILASFSTAGPTVEGFVKPDLVAPGGHMVLAADSLAVWLLSTLGSTITTSTSPCPAPPSRRR